MAQGDKSFNVSGQKVADSIPLIPKGDYTLKLKKYEIRSKQGSPTAVPYVAVTAEVEGTALSEGGKNRNIFFNILTSVLPSPKDGIANVNRSNGLVALARALAAETGDLPIVERDVTNEGDEQHQEFIDPKAITEWLAGLQGAEFRARIKEVKEQPPYGAKNEVDRFLPPAE